MHLHFWIPHAFVRIALFFISGILIGIYFPNLVGYQNAVSIFLLLIGLYILLYALHGGSDKYFFNLGSLGLLAVSVAGYINVLQQTDSLYEDHLSKIISPVKYYRAVITNYPEEKNKSWKLEAEVSEVNTQHGWQPCKATLYLYASKTDFVVPFVYGDVLLIKGSPSELAVPYNPGEFDYKQFLKYRNIYHQHFVRKEDVIFIGNAPADRLKDYAIKARFWAEKKLRSSIHGEQEQAIACALILGIKDGLDNELLSAYAATGAMHVLAVSGLHVGILYFILAIIFAPLKSKKYGRFLFVGISITLLWLYAGITGLSPSVMRAVTMFTFVAMGYAIKQRTNIYNTLAISAVVLLLFNPYFVMSVGFQLSYLAVLGIVYIQRPLYLLVEPTTRLVDWVWKISCVSIAAQVATFSLGLLYFHQFPNYFLFSNLFVIPLAFGVLVLGLSTIALSFFPFLAAMLGVVLGWTIKVLNFLVLKVESLPYSLMDNVYISTFQCWLLLFLVVAVILLFQFRQIAYLYSAFALAFIFSISQWIHFSEQMNEKKITVYSVTGHSAFDLMDGGKVYFFSDSALFNDDHKIRFHIRPNRLLSGINEINDGMQFPLLRQTSFGKIVMWKGKTILHIAAPDIPVLQKCTADYVIISNNAIKRLDDILKYVEVREIILDSSNSGWICEKLLKESETLTTKVYSVMHSGAFQSKL